MAELEGAACVGKPLDWFYPEHGQTGARGKEVCSTCPARRACLTEALERPETDDHGVWGGTTAGERSVLRGRPLARRVPLECLDCGTALPVVSGRGKKPERCRSCRRKRLNRSAAQRARDRYVEVARREQVAS